MRRLFSTFADGWPGAGLLLMRLVAGSVLILHGFFILRAGPSFGPGALASLGIAGGALLLARVAHWIGLPRKAPNPFRFSGVAVTWAAIVGISGYVIYLRFQLPH